MARSLKRPKLTAGSVLVWLLLGVPMEHASFAQSSGPSGTLSGSMSGGAAGAAKPAGLPRIIAGSQNTEVLRHRDFAGKPCLAIGGFARAHIGNQKLYDHVITIKNGCAQSIKIQICYFRTQECTNMDVPGLATKVGVLGTLPAIQDFQYEFRERF